MRRVAAFRVTAAAALTKALRGAATTMTIRDALNSAIDEELARDPAVFVLGQEVGNYQGPYKVTRGLIDKYGPERVVDTPITEHGVTGMAVGAALNGLRPICEFMTFNFAMQAIDQIVNSAAKGCYMSAGQLKCPIVFRGPNGAAAGVAAQHSQCYASWYSSVPGLITLSPFSSEDARGMIKAAVRCNSPVVILEHELMYGESYPVSDEALGNDFVIPFGKAKIEREGRDITFFSFSRGVDISLKAAEKLAAEGIEAEVINLRSLRPLDRDTIINSIKKTHRAVTVDESFPICNIGAEICALVMASEAFDYLDAPIVRVSCADCPTPYSKNLEAASQPQVEDVLAVAKRVLS
ncbi:unnamed protein product [Phytomonas sp. Hart1]|nr:unnamed protein product [Phytomonas sp. Hart1]|eukprot:CCW70970.1 unnamed protein product [Phytomonas sp. isolate Hart1]